MGKKKTTKRSKLKAFVKSINYNHIMPTRCVRACVGRLALFAAAAYCCSCLLVLLQLLLSATAAAVASFPLLPLHDARVFSHVAPPPAPARDRYMLDVSEQLKSVLGDETLASNEKRHEARKDVKARARTRARAHLHVT